MQKIIYALVLIFAFSFAAQAEFTPVKSLSGVDLFKGEKVQVEPKAKGLVTVFLSAKCPCSNSHVVELKELSNQYKDFAFVAVHSNVDEAAPMTKEYFAKAELPFPIIQDDKAQLADSFKALKTPHAYITSHEGVLLYQGGVSNSKDCAKADRKFLREALEDLDAGKKVRTPEGRTLGCAISRGEKNVW